MTRVFIDMDGVIADFDGLKIKLFGPTYEDGDKLVELKGGFRNLEVIPGSREAIALMPSLGYDPWIATRPAPSHPHSYSEKAEWIIEHFPALKKKLVMTQDKSLLGGPDDILIDDRLEKANCVNFPGKLIEFAYDPEHTPIRPNKLFRVRNWAEAINCLKWLAEK